MYLHGKLKLASFRGLRYLHFDVDEVEKHHTEVLRAFNESKVRPNDVMEFVVPPMLFWHEGNADYQSDFYDDDDNLDRYLQRAYRQKFGLY